MNIKSALPLLAVSLGLLATPGIAQQPNDRPSAPAKNEKTAKAGVLIPIGQQEAAWAAKARATYPLQTCVASDEKLGSMGDSPQFIYRVDGKPDRLVVFCCDGCIDDFKGDPAKHLAKLDAAQAKADAANKAGSAKGEKK